jgi:hypothetical protein
MGCGNSSVAEKKNDFFKEEDFYNKEEYVSLKHKPLNYNLVLYEDDKTDLVLLEIEKKLKDLEQYRTLLVDTADSLLINSGACLFKNPNIENIFDCIMIKLSNDHKGDIFKSRIKMKKESMEFFTETMKCKAATKELLNSFENYYKIIDALKVEFIAEKCRQELLELNKKHKNLFNNIVKSVGTSKIGLENLNEKFSKNSISHALLLLDYLEKDLYQALEFKHSFRKDGFMEKLFEDKNYDFYGKKSSDDGVVEPIDIISGYFIDEQLKYSSNPAEAARMFRLMKDLKVKEKMKIKST